MDLKEAYRISWNKLKNYYLTLDKQIENDNDVIQFEKDITEQIYFLLEQFVVDAKKVSKGKFQIGRGIIQINSFKINKRIRIPVQGNIENWSEKQKDWENEFFKSESSNGKELMYLEPNKPNHLLTELMWRFQSKDESVGKKDNKEIISFSVFKNDISGSPLEKTLESQTIKRIKHISLERGSINVSGKLENLKNKLNYEIKAKNPKVGGVKFSYSESDCKYLFRDPIKIFYSEETPYKNAQNIFYIAEIDESSYLGAFDFEVIALDDCNESDIASLYSFIKNIRWNLSKYLIELLANTERNFYSEGYCYKDMYFFSKIGFNAETGKKEKEYPGLKSLIKSFEVSVKDISKKNDPNWAIIQEVYNKVKEHFELAETDIGLYWKGYKRSAYEVSCCVASLIDLLFFDRGKNFNLERLVRSSGPELKYLFNKIEKEEITTGYKVPFIFKQLFQGLVREKELFLIPYYRDHFIHSFYCFCFGLLLMALAPKRIIKRNLDLLRQKPDKAIELVNQWFIISMWHDIAYILQKGNDIIEKYVLNYFQNQDKRFRKVLPWTPSLGNLLQVQGILDEIRTIANESIILDRKKFVFDKKPENNSVIKEITTRIESNNKIYKNTLFGVKEADLIIGVAFDHVDHGIWSSLFVNHALSNEIELCNSRLIAKAIMTHHISSWRIENLLNDFKFYQYIKDENKKHVTNYIHEVIKIDTKNNALGYLLCICDILSQAGREAIELADDLPSNLRIKYKEINWNEDTSTLEIELSHHNYKISNTNKHKFYKDPIPFLNLTFREDNRGDIRDCIRLELYNVDKDKEEKLIIKDDHNNDLNYNYFE